MCKPQRVTTVPATRLMRKRRRSQQPVTSTSVALFRLGEICNNHCPMCSNSGRAQAWQIAEDDLLRRVDFLKSAGMPRVVVTGGEPTIHPAFWNVVAKLTAHGIAWDINTHGRSFADPTFTERALAAGLERAIVSFHSHETQASCIISGTKPRGHQQTVDGLRSLIAAGCPVMLNLVLSCHNIGHLVAWVEFCAQHFAPLATGALELKVCFPYHGGKGGDWQGIQLRYDDVQQAVLAAGVRSAELGLVMLFESFPNCVVQDPDAKNLGRTGFGESHYLEDLRGQELFSMRHIESELSAYGEQCRECTALKRCAGVSASYAERHGTDELKPF
jgi:MoaA/NifB/PqqE/SkfB family radical SAM enzyme